MTERYFLYIDLFFVIFICNIHKLTPYDTRDIIVKKPITGEELWL